MWGEGDDDPEDIDDQQNESMEHVKQQEISQEVKQLHTYLIEKSEKTRRQIRTLLRKPDPEKYHDFHIDLIDLFDELPQFSKIFFQETQKLVEDIGEAVQKAQESVMQQIEIEKEQEENNESNPQQQNQMTNLVDKLQLNIQGKEDTVEEFKYYIQIKFINVPYTSNIYKKNLSSLDCSDLDKMVVLRGTVIRQTAQKTLEKHKEFKCVACSNQFHVWTSPDSYNQYELPQKCTNTVSKPKKENPFFQQFNKFAKGRGRGGGGEGYNNNKKQAQQKFVDQQCGGKKFDVVEGTQVLVDYQEVLIQEPFKTIKSGNIPKTIWVILEGTLVNSVKAGDDISITGILIKRAKKLVRDSRPDLYMAIVANNVEVKQDIQQTTQDDNFDNDVKQEQLFQEISFFWSQSRDIYSEIEARNTIIRSVCSHIYMKYDIKISLLLTLIGGVSGIQNNSRIRGQCHLLIVGEPGVGKSQFLKYAMKLAQRSIFTNGIGTSSAGLTVTHTKDGGEWVLEAGALVLADKGICCIDEFNLIKKQDFPSVLEAMEQQTISGFKAGTMSKLNTRTSIVAACNPVTAGQKYNPQYDLAQNIGISSPLISRFDLIFVVVDECNYEADMETCDFILGRFIDKKFNNNNSFNQSFQNENTQQNNQGLWSTERLKEYITFIQQKFEPRINQEAEDILSKYYNHLRNSEEKQQTTIRALQSLVRLSQAHARMMFRDEVQEFDAVCIVVLNECAFNTNLLPNIVVQDYILLNYEKYMEIEEMVKSRLGVIG